MTLVSIVHAGVPTLVNSATSSSCEGSSERLFSGSATLLSDFDLASCLVVSGHASTQTCVQGSTGLHVWWSLLAHSLTRASRTSGITFFSRGGLAVHLWTDVRVFLHFGFVRPAFEVMTKRAPWPASYGSPSRKSLTVFHTINVHFDTICTFSGF